jgi:hypothetical protein
MWLHAKNCFQRKFVGLLDASGGSAARKPFREPSLFSSSENHHCSRHQLPGDENRDGSRNLVYMPFDHLTRLLEFRRRESFR